MRHVVVTDRSRVAVVPIDRDPAPWLASDGALIGRVALPDDAISNNELPRFFTRHSGVPTAVAFTYTSAIVISTRTAT